MSDKSVKTKNENNWFDRPVVAFDTETTGSYPLQAELCEIAAVKWHQGKIIGEFQTLLKPSVKMSDFIISIHGITNEMVIDAPVIQDKIAEFVEFIGDAILVAHHAPFDLGFIAVEIEQKGIPLPKNSILCSSLISRAVITESPNHKLQTLIKHLNLPQGQAHRALDDAKACLEVLLECARRMEHRASLDALTEVMGKRLRWQDYSLKGADIANGILESLVKAIRQKTSLQIVYAAGSTPGAPRKLFPLGIVRNPDGDYLIARGEGESQTKRFYLNRIASAEIL